MAKGKNEIDKELQQALLQAKQKKPRYFALVLKGQEGALIVSKKKIKPGDISAAKKEVGGSKVVEGVCVGLGGANIAFQVTDKAPSGGERIVKKIAKDAAGLKLAPTFTTVNKLAEVNEDEPDEPIDPNALLDEDEGQDEEDDESPADEAPTSQQPVQQTTAPPVAPQMPGPTNAAEKEWKWRFEAIQKDLATVLKNEWGDFQKIRQVFELAQKQRETDTVKAVASLKACQALVDAALKVKGGEEESESDEGDVSLKQMYEDRVADLRPMIKRAEATGLGDAGRLQQLMNGAESFAGKDEYEKAHKALDEVDKLVAALLGRMRQMGAAEMIPEGAVEYAKLRLGWDSAVDKVRSDLAAFKTAVETEMKGEPDLKEIQQNLKAVDEILDQFNEDLQGALTAADDATSENERRSAHKQAVAIVESYIVKVDGNDLLQDLAANPVTPVKARQTLEGVLSLLNKRLGAWMK